jgi:predicted DNA-binding protein
MPKNISCFVTHELDRKLTRAASFQGKSKSEIMRIAIEKYLDLDDKPIRFKISTDARLLTD